MKKINEGREKHGKKPFNGSKPLRKRRDMSESETNPESGVFRK